MQVMLTERKDYLLNPNLNVGYSMEELYKIINRKEDDDDVLHIFVDNMFIATTNLKQIEMYSTSVSDFRIITNKDLSFILNLNKKLDLRFYYSTEVSKTAANLFWNAYPLEDINDLNEIKEEFVRITSSEQILKNMIDYDFVNLKSLFNSIHTILNELENSQFDMADLLNEYQRENKLLNENLTLARERNEEIEKNRVELLDSNLKLKYNGYLDELERPIAETSTPILYIKAPLVKDHEKLTKFVSILREHLQNKYNKNVCFIQIEDTNSLRIKKLNPEFNYVNSAGEYNIGLGNMISTVPQYVNNLMENFEKFSGIKDLFIVLDMAISPYVYIVGGGNLIFIKNDLQSEDLHENLDDNIVVLDEESVVSTFKGDDDFNLKLNISRSELFKTIEEVAIRISL